MNEQLKLLINLQEIDSAILGIAEKIELLPRKLEKPKARLKETNASLETCRTEYERLNTRKKQKYLELEDIQEKINRLKAKNAEIRTNKEYEAHLKEIKAFEDSRNEVEEEIISQMEAVEVLEKDLKKRESVQKTEEEKFRKIEKTLEDEKNELHSEMEVYKTRRKDVVRRIDVEYYERYMELIKSGGGTAVVRTHNEVCLGCHTNIPPQLYNDIRNDENIFNCCYCNRFLYHKVQ